MRYLLILTFSLVCTFAFSQQMSITTARPSDQIEKKFPYNIDLKDVNGKVFNTAKLFKKHKEPLVLVFWLTTCFPCRMEIEAYQKKYEQWKKEAKFRMVVISYDFQENYPNYVKRVADEKWQWETFNDMRKEFGSVLPGELNGLPQVFIFDKNGEISYQKRKYYPGDEDVLFQKIVEANQVLTKK